MVNFIKTQSSFANGEVSPNFFTNPDIHGLAHLENMDVMPGGGLARRDGLKKIAKISSNARLVSFSVAENEDCVLAIMNQHIRIYLNDTLAQDLTSPWSYTDLKKLQYAQRFGTMIFVHPDYKPKILYRENGVFKLASFTFAANDTNDVFYMPFMRFEDSENITITVSNSADGVHFTTNQAFWTADNVNGHLSLLGKTWLVTSYVSSTDIIATCNGAYTLPVDPVSDWQEAVFSPRRGWPCSITFHQDRLVFGGAKSWPGGIWMSCVGAHTNFNTGTGLDDQAIFFTLLSNRRQHICTLASSDNLQIFTSEGEWAVSNKPLTPESVNIKMHTSVGSVASRYLPPQQIDGKTVFASNDGKEIRELALDDLGENYKANNLCDMVGHLINNPIDIAYNKTNRRLFVVMSDGKMAILNYNVGLGVLAWSRYTTDGAFQSVAVSGNSTFVITSRNQEYFLEKFSSTEMYDADNKQIQILARGMPLMSGHHNTRKARITKIIARVHDTKTIFINDVRAALPNEIYANGANGFSGDVSSNILGTKPEFTDYPWTISTTDALPIKILSITVYGRYQI